MKILFTLLITLSFACNSKKVYREIIRTDKIDQDIILFNIGNSNRLEIAALLLELDKCNPLIVGVDVFFLNHRQSWEDSILATAFKRMRNDVLAYGFDSTGKDERSIDDFRKFVNDEGYVDICKRGGVSSHFIPIKKVDGKLYESFALKIVNRWKQGFQHHLPVDKPIPILFQRSQKQYYYFVKEDLLDKNVCELLKNRIVLVGFLGPGDEDKHFTPIKGNDKDQEGKPDTYGLVIQANAIRTILEYGKKN